jgi:uncharacterized protein (TIGR00299 family) protein
MTRARHAWIDASAGIAGDMLLGALLDAGASPEAVREAVAAVIPGEVRIDTTTVDRSGMRALKANVASVAEDEPHRTWATIRDRLSAAALEDVVHDRAGRVFATLAEAEAHVHGVAAEDVHFHEVGAWDSIADVVGVSAALVDLGIATVSTGPVALGSGRTAGAHGDLPVPVPAVLELARGWEVFAGGDGELATPTGMALVRAFADRCGPLPPMEVYAVGVGAGSKETPGRANVVRVVVGEPSTGHVPDVDVQPMWVLETNVDDLDPRVWPTVLESLLDAGAADAWLVPILMKKGRPAHTLNVLAGAERRGVLRDLVLSLTSTIGVRETAVARTALGRAWVSVPVRDGEVRVKVAHRDGEIVHATAEFADAAALAERRGVPVRQVLDEAGAAAEVKGLRPGQSLPAGTP